MSVRTVDILSLQPAVTLLHQFKCLHTSADSSRDHLTIFSSRKVFYRSSIRLACYSLGSVEIHSCISSGCFLSISNESIKLVAMLMAC